MLFGSESESFSLCGHYSGGQNCINWLAIFNIFCKGKGFVIYLCTLNVYNILFQNNNVNFLFLKKKFKQFHYPVCRNVSIYHLKMTRATEFMYSFSYGLQV